MVYRGKYIIAAMFNCDECNTPMSQSPPCNEHVHLVCHKCCHKTWPKDLRLKRKLKKDIESFRDGLG